MYAARGVIVGTVEETIMSAPCAYVERGVIVGTVGAIIFAAEGASAEKGVIGGTSSAREVVVVMVGSIGGAGGASGMVVLAVVEDGVVSHSMVVLLVYMLLVGLFLHQEKVQA